MNRLWQTVDRLTGAGFAMKEVAEFSRDRLSAMALLSRIAQLDQRTALPDQCLRRSDLVGLRPMAQQAGARGRLRAGAAGPVFALSSI